MRDLRRIDELLRAANPVRAEDEVMTVVSPTDPLWQTIASRLTEGEGVDLDPVPHRLEPNAGAARRPVLQAAAGLLLVATLGTALFFQARRTAEVGPTDSVPTGGSAEVPPATPEDARFSFTYSGESGSDGCRREGPELVTPGVYASSLTNAADAGAAVVTITRLAEGYDHDDFLAALARRGPDLPVAMAPGAVDPAQHPWMADDEWRMVHHADAGATQTLRTGLTLEPGRYVVFCWTEEAAGKLLWPLGPLTVVE